MSFELVGVKLVAEEGNYFSTMAKADKAIAGFGDTADKTFKQMPSLADIATGALHRVGAMAIEVFAQAGQAAVGFITDSIGAAGDFEAGMNRFSAVAGQAIEDAGLELKDFRDQFIQIGKELPVSTAEVQEAAIEMAKGGIEPATIAAGGLKQVIQFAAAADLDLAQASTIAAKALGGWTDMAASADEKAQFLAHSTDLLQKAANASTVDVDELALGLYNVQGTAKLAGVSFDETVTALAQFAPAFGSSADAGTSFKAFLGRLQPSTKPAIAAMKDLGLYTDGAGSAFYDAKGNFIGMEAVAGKLKNATKGLSEAQRVQALQTIFGQDAIRVAAILSEQGAEGYNNMADALAKQNSVQDMAAQKQAGFNTALDNFKGSVEALQITIGTVLLPILTDLFNNYLAPGINILTDITDAIFGNDEAFNRLSPTLQSVVSFVGELFSGSGELSSFWTNTLLPSVQSVGAYFEEKIVPILQNVGAIVMPMVGASLQILAGFWSNVLWPALQLVWGILDAFVIPILTDLTSWLAKVLPPVIQKLADFWTGVLFPAIHDIFSFTQANLIPILQTTTQWLRDNLPPAIQKLTDFWNTKLLPAITEVWGFISTKLAPLFMALVNVQIAVLQVALQSLADLWETILAPAITFVYELIRDKIIPEFNAANDTIRTVLGPAFDWLGDNVLAPVVDWFSTISEKIESAIGWLNDLAETIRNLPSLPDAFVGHSPPPMADWFNAIGMGAANAALGIGAMGSTVQSIPANPLALMASGSTANTYNNQRNVNLNYQTTYAPPVNQSLAIARALA